MGSGVSVEFVNCSDFTDAKTIDDTITKYMIDGLRYDAVDMLSWAWAPFCISFWYGNAWAYTYAMNNIINCGISNNVEGSKYASQYFYEKRWTTFMDTVNSVYDVPGAFYMDFVFRLFLAIISGGLSELVYFVVSLIVVFTHSPILLLAIDGVVRGADMDFKNKDFNLFDI
jgi:hypothetical protein